MSISSKEKEFDFLEASEEIVEDPFADDSLKEAVKAEGKKETKKASPRTKKKDETPKVEVKEESKEEIKEEPEEEIKEEPVEAKASVVRKKKVFDDNDLIACRSVTNGKYIYTGKATGTPYRFMNYGDIEYIAYKDLRMAANNTGSNTCCYAPFIIVDNEEFVEEFPKLKEFYAGMYTTRDYIQILALSPEEMARAIEKMPKVAKETLKGLVATMIKEGSIDSLKKIKTLESVFGAQTFITNE